MLSDADLDAMLAEVDEQREGIAAELRAAQDEAAAVRRIEAARSSLLSAGWEEDPDAIQPGQWPTLGASPEQIRAA